MSLIFSFGAVFYEMLTGVRAFKRDTAAETMTPFCPRIRRSYR
jgi:hypothetical protein